jgi:hypothetical protein
VKDFLVLVFVVIMLVALFIVLGGAAKSLSFGGFSLGGWYQKWSVANPGERAHVVMEVSNETLWKSANALAPGESPYKGKITFDTLDNDPQQEDPHDEYITIRSSIQNEKAIPLAGWSVESMVSKTRIPLPEGVLLYVLGRENAHVSPVLAPGEYAYIVTGNSPLGDSFHTNTCIGALATYASFTPTLPERCAPSGSAMSASIENVRTYGEQCIEYIHSLASCEVPGKNVPADLLPLCRSFVQKEITYNKCLEREYKKDGFRVFNLGGWYLYLESPAEIWRNKYDVLRLLDGDGRVVDVHSY